MSFEVFARRFDVFWRKANRSPAPESSAAFKSSFVRAAARLGLLTGDKALEADRLIEAEPTACSQDIVVQAGLLTTEQAERVDDERKATDKAGFLDDQFKRASAVLDDAHAAGKRMFQTITQPIAIAEVTAARKKALK